MVDAVEYLAQWEMIDCKLLHQGVRLFPQFPLRAVFVQVLSWIMVFYAVDWQDIVHHHTSDVRQPEIKSRAIGDHVG